MGKDQKLLLRRNMMLVGMWGKLVRGTSGADDGGKDALYAIFVFQERTGNILLSEWRQICWRMEQGQAGWKRNILLH